MSDLKYIVALDQGTTSSRAVVFTTSGEEVRSASVSLPVQFPADGWVEQNAEEIFDTQIQALREATKGIDPHAILALGLTNQRETTIAWERDTGKPVAPAIVWQCRRSVPIVERMKSEGREADCLETTGLVLDAYFSGTKILWLLENISGLRARVDRGEICFGTVDSYLIYRLSGGRSFVTERSNASRTLLFGLESGKWEPKQLALFGVSEKNLATIKPSAGILATTNILGPEIPISGCLGDQQASLYGHGCLKEKSVKCTFGTGAFLLLNTGKKRVRSQSGLLSTVSWGLSVGNDIESEFAIEGSIFVAGSLIQWFRDKLHFFSTSPESEALARSVDSSGGVVFVPALTGLGAPRWNSSARGSITGITRDTTSAHLVRAGFEGVAHTVADLFECAEFSGVTSLNIDGGMSANGLFCQILADFLDCEVIASPRSETTAFGAAALAAYGAGIYPSAEKAITTFLSAKSSGSARHYQPTITLPERSLIREQWRRALDATIAASEAQPT